MSCEIVSILLIHFFMYYFIIPLIVIGIVFIVVSKIVD